MSAPLILAIDQGTTNTKALLVTADGAVIASASAPMTVSYPQSGWVQQDPVEILSRQIACMIEVQFTSGIHSDRIRAIGFGDTMPVDANTSEEGRSRNRRTEFIITKK